MNHMSSLANSCLFSQMMTKSLPTYIIIYILSEGFNCHSKVTLKLYTIFFSHSEILSKYYLKSYGTPSSFLLYLSSRMVETHPRQQILKTIKGYDISHNVN